MEENTMKRFYHNITILAAAIALLMTAGIQPAQAGDKDKDKEKRTFRAELRGYDRVPPNSTPATGEFKAKLSHDETSLDFEVSYQNLTGDLTDLHLQFGQ